MRKGFKLTDGIPGHSLRNYYRRAYEAIRSICRKEPVVLPDGGWPQGFRRFL